MDLMHLLIYLVVWGLILYILWWAIGYIGLPQPFAKVAQVVLVLVTVLVLVNVLLSFLGTPLFRIGSP